MIVSSRSMEYKGTPGGREVTEMFSTDVLLFSVYTHQRSSTVYLIGCILIYATYNWIKLILKNHYWSTEQTSSGPLKLAFRTLHNLPHIFPPFFSCTPDSKLPSDANKLRNKRIPLFPLLASWAYINPVHSSESRFRTLPSTSPF
jgi:hypothetical protein